MHAKCYKQQNCYGSGSKIFVHMASFELFIHLIEKCPRYQCTWGTLLGSQMWYLDSMDSISLCLLQACLYSWEAETSRPDFFNLDYKNQHWSSHTQFHVMQHKCWDLLIEIDADCMMFWWNTRMCLMTCCLLVLQQFQAVLVVAGSTWVMLQYQLWCLHHVLWRTEYSEYTV